MVSSVRMRLDLLQIQQAQVRQHTRHTVIMFKQLTKKLRSRLDSVVLRLSQMLKVIL